MATLINATDLCVQYNHNAVLKGATLTISEGDRVGLVGRNGSGKTTLLKILAGLQVPDSGTVTWKRELVMSFLAQDFALDPALTVEENIRVGARHLLDLIAEFEALPADSGRHSELEERIQRLEGWTLDQRVATAMSHLNCPAGDRAIDTLSGGEKRRVAMCRALVSQPDVLVLDEPTNHLDPEAIDWMAEFLADFKGAYIVATHDRYFLDQVVERVVEVSDGKLYSHPGNYTDYLLGKAERQAADEVIEHKRQMFLKKELAWVRRGPSARRTKLKHRIERYYEVAEQESSGPEEDLELCIPPPPPMGNRVLELSNLGATLDQRVLFRGFNFKFEAAQRVGVVGRNGLGKTTLLRIIMGLLEPTEGVVRAGQLTRFNYFDQSRVQLDEEHTALEEVSEGAETITYGEARMSARAYLKRFLFTDDRISTQVKYLSGGERGRLLLARILKHGGNFLVLDEPTNDLDLPTLRVLEEALLAFPGVVLVVSHDRYFLNRICTHILAFEGDGKIVQSVGNYDYYLEKKSRAPAFSPVQVSARVEKFASVGKTQRPRKLTFKEARELEGMETRILETEGEISRIESLFASPDFHRTHALQTTDLMDKLALAKQELTVLYARWEELEAIKSAQENRSDA